MLYLSDDLVALCERYPFAAVNTSVYVLTKIVYGQIVLRGGLICQGETYHNDSLFTLKH